MNNTETPITVQVESLASDVGKGVNSMGGDISGIISNTYTQNKTVILGAIVLVLLYYAVKKS